jgi:hypothetical protein
MGGLLPISPRAQNHSERQRDSDSFFDLVLWPMPQVFEFLLWGLRNETHLSIMSR